MSNSSRLGIALGLTAFAAAALRYVPDLRRITRSTRTLLAVDISSVIQPSRKKNEPAVHITVAGPLSPPA